MVVMHTGGVVVTCDAVVAVLNAWKREGHVVQVVFVGVAVPAETVVSVLQAVAAEPDDTAVLVVDGNSTALTETDWEVWEVHWRRGNRWLWCTADTDGAAVWGVLGGSAAALRACLVWHVCAGSLGAAIARLQGSGHLDAPRPSARLIWRLAWPFQRLPGSDAFTGPHRRVHHAAPHLLAARADRRALCAACVSPRGRAAAVAVTVAVVVTVVIAAGVVAAR